MAAVVAVVVEPVAVAAVVAAVVPAVVAVRGAFDGQVLVAYLGPPRVTAVGDQGPEDWACWDREWRAFPLAEDAAQQTFSRYRAISMLRSGDHQAHEREFGDTQNTHKLERRLQPWNVGMG